MVKIASAVYKRHFGGCRNIREDMIQEGILGIILSERLYDESRGVSRYTFAWNYAKGAMMSFYKREKRHRETFCSLPDLDIYQGIVEDYNKKEEKDKRLEKIYLALSEIDEKSKDIFINIVNGEKQKDIAERMGMSRQLVNVRYKRAKEKIRKKAL